jgi:hypothetical protein
LDLLASEPSYYLPEGENMKSKIVLLSTLTLFALSCNILVNTTPTPPAAQTEAPAIEPTTPVTTGNAVTLNNVTFTIPQGLAKDALSEMVSAADPNSAPWDLAPAHSEFTLTSYQLQDKFHQPKIFVYPAEEYAQVQPSVAENIQRIKNIAAGAQLSKDSMPGVPAFNAGQLIATKMESVTFQSGGGIRFLTEYSQYPATVNNHDLFYLFEGLTSDGKYYIIAILPVTAPLLAENEKHDAVVPTGGVSIPADTGPNESYYADITDKLNALAAEDFRPSLAVLDALVQSLVVTP